MNVCFGNSGMFDCGGGRSLWPGACILSCPVRCTVSPVSRFQRRNLRKLHARQTTNKRLGDSLCNVASAPTVSTKHLGFNPPGVATNHGSVIHSCRKTASRQARRPDVLTTLAASTANRLWAPAAVVAPRATERIALTTDFISLRVSALFNFDLEIAFSARS